MQSINRNDNLYRAIYLFEVRRGDVKKKKKKKKFINIL